MPSAPVPPPISILNVVVKRADGFLPSNGSTINVPVQLFVTGVNTRKPLPSTPPDRSTKALPKIFVCDGNPLLKSEKKWPACVVNTARKRIAKRIGGVF